MQTKSHIDLGKKGEEVACKHLLKNGYRIIARNWRYLKGEIDIVAVENNLLVIVEVKTRSSFDHGDPEDAITKKKLRWLYDTTDRYMEVFNETREVRYDLITVVFHGSTWTLEHIPDAWYPFMNT